TSGADRPSGKATAALAPAGVSAQAQHPLTPWTVGAGHFPVSRSHTKGHGASPMDENPPLFLPAVTYDGGGFPCTFEEFKSVAVADVNGDGKPDLVVGNCGDSTVGVLLGNGDGTFQPAVTYFTYFSGCWNPTAVAVADLNGDGKPDLVMGCGSIAAVGVMLGNGDGTFQPAVTYDSGPGYAV